jgi:hypothetical protein
MPFMAATGRSAHLWQRLGVPRCDHIEVFHAHTRRLRTELRVPATEDPSASMQGSRDIRQVVQPDRDAARPDRHRQHNGYQRLIHATVSRVVGAS